MSNKKETYPDTLYKLQWSSLRRKKIQQLVIRPKLKAIVAKKVLLGACDQNQFESA